MKPRVPLSDNDPLRGPWLKVNRAKENIDEFDARFKAWVDAGVYDVSAKLNRNRTEQVVKIRRTRSIPVELYCVFGDAIHNLRAALDQLAFILATEVAGCTDRRALRNCYFPLGDNATEFKATLESAKNAGRFNGPIVRFFREYQPYPKGKHEALYTIHKLDIADKHRVVIRLLPDDQVGVSIGRTRRWVKFGPDDPPQVTLSATLDAKPEEHARSYTGILVDKVEGVPRHKLQTMGYNRKLVLDVLNRAEELFFPALIAIHLTAAFFAPSI
jgi:hypothetical protein